VFLLKFNIILRESSACIFVVQEYTTEDYVGMYVCMHRAVCGVKYSVPVL
jgi:hypothetical protein